MRVIFASIAFSLALYVLITGNNELLPYTLFFLSAMLLVSGISEIKLNRKSSAIMCFLASAFGLFVSIYTFQVEMALIEKRLALFLLELFTKDARGGYILLVLNQVAEWQQWAKIMKVITM